MNSDTRAALGWLPLHHSEKTENGGQSEPGRSNPYGNAEISANQTLTELELLKWAGSVINGFFGNRLTEYAHSHASAPVMSFIVIFLRQNMGSMNRGFQQAQPHGTCQMVSISVKGSVRVFFLIRQLHFPIMPDYGFPLNAKII